MTSYLHDPTPTFLGFVPTAWRALKITSITKALVFNLIMVSRNKVSNVIYKNFSLYAPALFFMKKTPENHNTSGA